MTSATNIPVHIKKNRTAGDWVILILLIVGGLVMLFPFIVLLLNAFKTTADYNSSGPLSWPHEFSTDGLMKFWNRVNYPEKLWNSIWTSGLVAVLAVILSMLNAFALGIGRVKGRRWIVLLIMLANMLPQEAMLYPLYIMFKKIGLYNSPWAIVIIFTVIQSAFGTYLLSSVYGTFPKSILEAASIDGAKPLDHLPQDRVPDLQADAERHARLLLHLDVERVHDPDGLPHRQFDADHPDRGQLADR